MTTTLIIPGLQDSGPGHWQTWWQFLDPNARRVEQRDWRKPDLARWSARIMEALARTHEPVWLVAHSFGCLAAVRAAAECPDRVAGALLVAPADPDCFGIEPRLPAERLPCPSILVASSNDPWMSFQRAVFWADRWGSRRVDLGRAGHINAESGFGPWPQGRALLKELQEDGERPDSGSQYIRTDPLVLFRDRPPANAAVAPRSHDSRRIAMPLQHLIDYFNQRFTEENGLTEPPLSYDGKRVEGRFGASRFTSRLRPVRLASAPSFVSGHDAGLVVASNPDDEDAGRLLFADDVPNIVSLDRLSRTVHMLNYLPISHDDGTLFVHVHPRHVLTVKRDHGAYFEEIILRCGLTLRRVAITLTVSPVYDRQLTLLLERLKTYRDRGYATAIKFDDLAGDDFLERYCIEFLYRFTPDFVRFDCRFFRKGSVNPAWERRRASLLSAIRRLDTQLLLEGVKSETDAQLARILNADFVQGEWYEQAGNREQPRQIIAAGG